ncbi:MAG TPA: hypothetical protein VG603_09390 [Chitinophagales bacterium]|nr:hypothetical protein [Chitinophagales bacterium]
MKKFVLIMVCVALSLAGFSQAEVANSNGDLFRSNHKIYVVMAVLAIILTAIFVFLFGMERRLKNLENSQKP